MANNRTDEMGYASESVGLQVGEMRVELVGGEVTLSDLEYACDELRGLCGDSARGVEHCRAHLCTDIGSDGRSIAIADTVLILDGDLVMCAGAACTTMREAIDELSSRLRRRLGALRERDERSSPRSHVMAATTPSEPMSGSIAR